MFNKKEYFFDNTAWILTIQKKNLQQAGIDEIYDDNIFYDELSDFLINHWVQNGFKRKAAVVICESDSGLFHVHMAIYGLSTDLFTVKTDFWNCHVEPQLGKAKDVYEYLTKTEDYSYKNEKVLYSKGLENIDEPTYLKYMPENEVNKLKKLYTSYQIEQFRDEALQAKYELSKCEKGSPDYNFYRYSYYSAKKFVNNCILSYNLHIILSKENAPVLEPMR